MAKDYLESRYLSEQLARNIEEYYAGFKGVKAWVEAEKFRLKKMYVVRSNIVMRVP